jgi:[acyl-carrier-protein] S-malonyltransferase
MGSSKNRVMYIFPGQGSQYRGIGSDLVERFPVARMVYERASDALHLDVAALSFDASEEELSKTRNTQPVLLTHSMACLEVFREITGGQIEPSLTAGHSVGEYAALTAAGALEFEDAMRLVQERGRLMGELGQGQMLALPMDVETVRTLAEKHYCGIGACNLPEQTVIGGLRDDLERVRDEVTQSGARGKSPVFLKTEGAFHTYLMVPAAEAFRPSLQNAPLKRPRCRVLSNYTGTFHNDEDASIRSALFFQLFHPVQWFGNLEQALGDGVDAIVEFGGGIGDGATPAEKRPNLAGIIKRAIRAQGASAAETLYLPAINVETIIEAGAALTGAGVAGGATEKT